MNQTPESFPSKRKMSPLALVLILSCVFFGIFLLISGVLYLGQSPSSSGKSTHLTPFAQSRVGVVEVNGVILDSKKTVKKLEQMEEDDDVKAVVVRLNTPGGAVAPSQEIYEAIKRIRRKKPVIASMASVTASGGYYIACGADKIFANPGTITASIGVISDFLNLEKLYEWAKVKRYVIKTGKFKDTGSDMREMTEEERALLQTMMDNVLLQFKKAVSEGRKMKMEEVNLIADGRIMSGEQAKAAKLVDELGTFQDAVAEAGRLGNIKGKPRIQYPDRPKRHWLKTLLEESESDEDAELNSAQSSGSLFSEVLRRVLGTASTSDSLLNQLRSTTSVNPGVYWLWLGAR